MTPDLPVRAVRGALVALLAFCVTLGCGLFVPQAYAATLTAAPTADQPEVQISLGSGGTTIAHPKQAVVISGSITDTTGVSSGEATLEVAIGSQLLDTETELTAWRLGRVPYATTVVGSQKLPALAPGKSTPFKVTIPAGKLNYTYGLGSLPMVVRATIGGVLRNVQRTTLTWQSAATLASPVQTSWIVPLTLPADPRLFGPTGEARTSAWRAAIGPGSAIELLLDRLSGLPITWVVDPDLVDPPAAADSDLPPLESTSSPSSSSESPTPTSSSSAQSPSDSSSQSSVSSSVTSPPDSSSASSTTSTPASSSSTSSDPPVDTTSVDAMVSALRTKLAAAAATQDVWWTPPGDPDLSTLLRTDQGKANLTTIARRALPASLQAISRTVVAAPVQPVTHSSLPQLTAQWRTATGQAPTVVTSRASVAAPGSMTTSSVSKVAGTTKLVATDDSLSAVLDSDDDAGSAARDLMARTIAIYQQAPGTSRSVSISVPRWRLTTAVDASRAAAVIRAVQDAPWLTQVRTSALAPVGDAHTEIRSTATSVTPVPEPAIDPDVFSDAQIARTQLATINSFVVQPDPVVGPRRHALDEMFSTRWRDHSNELTSVRSMLTGSLHDITDKVRVSPSTVNFFTDSGRLAVTVVNDLSRPVHGITVTLTPRKYLLRVEHQPAPIDLRPKSRASVRATLNAVAAGQVPLDAEVTAPNGATLGPTTPDQLQLNVRPTATWLYGVLGIVAALVLVVGVARSIRRGPRRSEIEEFDEGPTPKDAVVTTELPRTTDPAQKDLDDE